MVKIGYMCLGEEHKPNDMVRYARLAEESDFEYVMVSDHYHPWLTRQGNSPFIWGVIGGIAHATQKIPVGTAVTCPTFRIHPAVIAQAAATAGSMLPGRFWFGVGSGENLNEHIIGEHWPPADIRQEMLEEAVDIIRSLWTGKEISHYGAYYIVENAKLFTLPDELPPIYVAAAGSNAAEVAGNIGDGLISTSSQEDLVKQFKASGGEGKPCFGQVTVCWAENEDQALKTAHECWPNTGLPGALKADLQTTDHFDQAVELVTEEMVAESVVCGPDKNKHLDEIQEMIDAGFDHVYIHQVGPDQEGFFNFYRQNILPELR
jgi:coenzyme F420-dependent glucose-6-phosphate dehydrogenase